VNNNLNEVLLGQVLSVNGYSVTRQRLAVFNSLSSKEPISMRQLIGELEGQLDRVSVYRTVALFERLGVLVRLTNGFKYKIELTGNFNSHHHHLNCTECGKVIDLNSEVLEQYIRALAEEYNFVLTHQVEIQGKCAECLKTKRA
jgi:Fur family ferric uptake transcriptional regulator